MWNYYILQRHCVKTVAITRACYFNSNEVNSTIFEIYLWYTVDYIYSDYVVMFSIQVYIH